MKALLKGIVLTAALIVLLSLASRTGITQWVSQDLVIQPPYQLVFGNELTGSVFLKKSGSSSISMSGIFSTYNGNTLVGNGLRSFQGAYSNASLNAAVSPAVNIVATTINQTEVYDVAWSIFQNASGTGCSGAASATPTIAWTDPAGNSDHLAFTAVSLPGTMAACTTANTGCGQGGVKIQAQAGSAITIAIAWTNGTGCSVQPTAQVFASAEIMN